METTTKNNDNEEGNKSGFFSSPAHLLVLIVVFLVLVAGGIYIKNHRQTKPAAPVNSISKGSSLTLVSGQLKPQLGSQISVDVWEDSGVIAVNAVQASVKYSTDSFQFVSINDSDSAFEIKAPATSKKGIVVIARGHKGSLTGRQQVATIKFKVIGMPIQTSLMFSNASLLLGQVNNKNILDQRTGLDFKIGAKW